MIKEKSWPESKNIKSATYDEENLILTVTFVGGNMYKYFAIPIQIWEEMILAPSVGGFFARSVRNKYSYEKING